MRYIDDDDSIELDDLAYINCVVLKESYEVIKAKGLKSFYGFGELNLYKNNISDTSPLSEIKSYYLKLSNNRIENISAADIARVAYLLDLSDNKIKSARHLFKEPGRIRRFFINGNELTEDEKEEISKMDFVRCRV